MNRAEEGCFARPALIDLERIHRTFGDDREFMEDCASHFNESFPKLLEEIERAIGDADCVELGHAAHAFCGVVGSYSTSQPYLLSRRLEAQGQAGILGGAPEVAAELREATMRLAAELRAMISVPSAVHN